MDKLTFEKDKQPVTNRMFLRDIAVGEAFTYPGSTVVRIRVTVVFKLAEPGYVQYMSAEHSVHEVPGQDLVIPVDIDPVKWRERKAE